MQCITMDPDVSLRYREKVQKYCLGIDPYQLGLANDPIPRNLHYFDICNYCIGKDSAYTHESLRAFKTLESYKLYESGWIQSLQCKKIATGSILVGTVKHSYRINEKPLRCWVSINRDGLILTGHCECMAGLGEVCTHIGAIFFLVEDWGRTSQKLQNPDAVSCTDVLAQWLVPTTKKVEMASICDIQWGKSIKRDVNVSFASSSFLSNDSAVVDVADIAYDECDEDTEADIDSFLHKIQAKGVFCPIMAMREPFAQFFIEKEPQELLTELRTDDDEYNISVIYLYLGSRHNIAYEELSLDDLREIANEIHLTYTEDEIQFIESKTRDQSSCKLWYRFRAGRITGSMFKRVCRTDTLAPSIDTIDRICYPERHIFTSQQTTYGIKNEPVARKVYEDAMLQVHQIDTTRIEMIS